MEDNEETIGREMRLCESYGKAFLKTIEEDEE